MSKEHEYEKMRRELAEFCGATSTADGQYIYRKERINVIDLKKLKKESLVKKKKVERMGGITSFISKILSK